MPHRVKYRSALGSTTVLIAAILLLAAFATALGFGAEIGHGINSDTTPIVTTILSTLGGAIVGLLALIKATHAEQKTDAVNTKVNGHIARLTEAAINAGVKPEDLPPLPPEIRKPD